jgi:putative addiction module component (TIGR02574 family)
MFCRKTAATANEHCRNDAASANDRRRIGQRPGQRRADEWSRTQPQTLIARCRATLAFTTPRIILLLMAIIAEVEKLALDLPESQRAVLAAHLLGSLPSILHDEDEGIAEALRRDAELDADPVAGISLEQLDRQIERRRS